MKCPGCSKDLAKYEIAQPALVNGKTVYVRSFCDECCRRGTWIPGSADSLERLVAYDAVLQSKV